MIGRRSEPRRCVRCLCVVAGPLRWWQYGIRDFMRPPVTLCGPGRAARAACAARARSVVVSRVYPQAPVYTVSPERLRDARLRFEAALGAAAADRDRLVESRLSVGGPWGAAAGGVVAPHKSVTP